MMKKKLIFVVSFILISIILFNFTELIIENQKNIYINKFQTEHFFSYDMIEFLLHKFVNNIFSITDVHDFFKQKKDTIYDIVILSPDKSEFFITNNLKNPLSPITIQRFVYSQLDIPLNYFSFSFEVDDYFYISSIKKTEIGNESWYIILITEHSDFYKTSKFWRLLSHSVYFINLLLIYSLIFLLGYFKSSKKEISKLKYKEKCFLQNFISQDYNSLSVLVNKKGFIEAISPNFMTLLSYSENEVIGNHLKFLSNSIDINSLLTNNSSSENNMEVKVIDNYKNERSMFATLLPCNRNLLNSDDSDNLTNSDLFEKVIIIFNDLTKIKDSNQKLQKEINKNSIFTKIAQMITISHEPRHIIKTIIEETRNLIDYDSGTLFLLDNAYLVPYYTNNESLSHVINNIKLKVGEGLTGLVAKIKKGMIVNDASNSPVAVTIDNTPEINECLISCPLINNDKLIGVVTFSREGNKYFTDEDLKILELLSVQAAAVLDNSILLKKLRDSENKYYSMINESALGMIILNNRKITFSNKRFSQYLDYSLSNLLGKDIVELISTKDKSFFASQLTTFLLDGKIEVFEIELIDSKKQSVIFEFSLSSIVWENNSSILITASNITEKIQLNKQLLQTQKLESVGALASGIAHDFKNVLAGIIGAADMIILKTSESSPINHFAKIIKTSAERGSKLSQRLLGFSRVDEQDKEIFDLNELLREVIEIVSYTFEKNIELKHNLFAEPLTFEGDSVKIQQCLLNLCVNARDAMPEGGSLIVESSILDSLFNETSEKINTFIANNELAMDRKYNYIKISDTGCGIPKNIHENIFEPFFTTKEKGKGTGLGLSTTKTIVKEYKGVIFLESEEGKGTSFIILLPWIKSINNQLDTMSQINDISSHSILLVDDEEIVLDVAKDLLEELGNKVYAVNNGTDALKILKMHTDIDIAILDRMMPKMDGLTLFRKIKVLRPEVKVIIASGFIQKAEAENIIAEGALDYISKPYHLEDLIKLLKK